MKFDLRELVVTALFVAIVILATMVLRINLPSVNGYINIGDSMIFVCAILVGPRSGFFAGAIGSALADLLLGATLFAPFTFVIKGLEGYLVGAIYTSYLRKMKFRIVAEGLAIVAGALWMWAGYFLTYTILFGFKAAIPASLGDIFQVIGSILIGLPIVLALKRTNIFRYFTAHYREHFEK